MKLVLGQKIKALRLAADLTQEELANRAMLSKGFISQLENDQTSVQIDSLADIVEALGTNLADFFVEEEEPKVVYSPEERVALDGTGARKFELMVAGSTTNQMDPVMLTLESGESLAKGDPHPGEQFGYVLKGTLTLKLGKKSYKVKKNHCFYFRAEQEHQFRNDNSKTAVLLRVTAPPQM